jgi:hypothetical protein
MKVSIFEEDLKNLIYAANKYFALESGGVDNWDWYGASYFEYLEAISEEYCTKFEDFDELTEFELNNYKMKEGLAI